MALHDADGKFVQTVNADLRGDGQAYCAHRADVYDLLLAALPRETIHLGLTVADVMNADDRAVARFSDGLHVRAKLIVGADGIRSATRAAIARDELIFSQLVILRGIAPASALPVGMSNDRINVWARGDRKMVCLPMRAGSLVAMDPTIAQTEPPEDLWNSQVSTQTALPHFRGFDSGLLRLIEAGMVPVVANPVYDRETLDNWSSGRITLLGDAAHPMQPLQGQGANQAIQDAAALAHALAELTLDDAPEAVRRYQAERIAPTRQIQAASRKRLDVLLAS